MSSSSARPGRRRWLGGLLAVLILGSAATAAAELSYVGSSTIDDNIIPAAAEAFARKTGVKLGAIATQGSGQGLELVVRGAAPLAGVSRGPTFVEKQQRIYYQTIGYDAVAVYVHGSNPVTSLSKAALKGIYTGRNDQNYWQGVDVYITEHSDAQITHGICPECKARIREQVR